MVNTQRVVRAGNLISPCGDYRESYGGCLMQFKILINAEVITGSHYKMQYWWNAEITETKSPPLTKMNVYAIILCFVSPGLLPVVANDATEVVHKPYVSCSIMFLPN